MTMSDRGRVIEIQRVDKPITTFYWLITDYCNFECSYCHPLLHSGEQFNSGNESTEQDIITFVDRLCEMQKVQQVGLMISGGEPTIHPQIQYIIERITSVGGFVSITTNGSRPLAWWQKLSPLPTAVRISLHREFTDIKKVNELALYLNSRSVNVLFNLMADPNHWDWVEKCFAELDPSLHEMIESRKIRFPAENDVGQYTLYPHYTEEQEKVLNRLVRGVDKEFEATRSKLRTEQSDAWLPFSPNRLINSGGTRFLGWHCTAGSQGFSITSSGAVYAGICRAKYVGNIRDFKPLPQPIRCPFKMCKCPADVLLPKFNGSLV